MAKPKTVIFWQDGSAARARQMTAAGGVIFIQESSAALDAAGIPYRTAIEVLGEDALDEIDDLAMRWNKDLGRAPLIDGRSLRDLMEWQGLSLWWFAELYLHHSTSIARYVRLIETWSRVLKSLQPAEVECAGLPLAEEILLARTCIACGVLFHGRERGAPDRGLTRLISWRSRWNTLKTIGSALKAGLTGGRPRPAEDARRTILFLSHAAFWKTRRDPNTHVQRIYEHYFDRLIPEIAGDAELKPFVVAVGPQAAFRRRSAVGRLWEWLRLPAAQGEYVPIQRYTNWLVVREVWRATRDARELWRRLARSSGWRQICAHRGVRFADLGLPGLAGTLLLQLPWAVRSMAEIAAVLRLVRPAGICLYSESSGWGRAALAAARAQGIPSLAIQHGILYPKYYSYRHDPDEGACPLPDRTAVFGDSARRLLRELGHYPPASFVLTGCPRFDDLVKAAAAWDRDALRARFGVTPQDKLLLIASRYRGIRETHQSIGSVFERLIRGIDALDNVACLVKPHPAEPADEYEAAVKKIGARRMRVLPPSTDLTELLHAADALITVESLSAIEALVLHRPVLILNMPTNLKDLVVQGVAMGVPLGADPAPAVRALLFDEATQARLREARARYIRDLAGDIDGQATARIARLLREMVAPASRDSVGAA